MTNVLTITYNGETKPIRVWAEQLGTTYDLLYEKIFYRGCSVEKVFKSIL